MWLWQFEEYKITQHASYLILHGSKHIVPCTKRHIGKEDKVQFIDGWLTPLFSSATGTFHTTANVTSHKCDSGYKLSKNLFGTSLLFPYMVLLTSIKIQKKFLKNSWKPKMQKPSNNINNSFWSALYLSSLMISMLKSYPSHVLVLFMWWMVLGPPFHHIFLLVCWRLQINLQIHSDERECGWYCVVEWCLLEIYQIILNSLIKHKLSIFGWFLATKFFNPVQMYLKRFWWS